eukprot:Seg3124.1 transcript_id=Seg3124.1/GoldUCD/mRNA.D3Y31 product="hypothetical protein" pseudo=true protein_id=Seg3124.1/GoldUCD/D3Y31
MGRNIRVVYKNKVKSIYWPRRTSVREFKKNVAWKVDLRNRQFLFTAMDGTVLRELSSEGTIFINVIGTRTRRPVTRPSRKREYEGLANFLRCFFN